MAALAMSLAFQAKVHAQYDEDDPYGDDPYGDETSEPAQPDSDRDEGGDEDAWGDDAPAEVAPPPAAGASSDRAEVSVSLGAGGEADGEWSHLPFMLRAGLGAGYGMATATSHANLEMDGLSLTGQAAVGFAIAKRLVLQVEGMVAALPMANLSIASKYRTVYFDDPGFALAYMVGFGVTHWLQPGDYYISASVGPAWASLTHEDIELANLKMGVGLLLAVGKTFWLSSNLGLNLGIYFNYMSIPDHSGEFTHVLPDCEGGDCADIVKHRFGVSNFGIATGLVFH